VKIVTEVNIWSLRLLCKLVLIRIGCDLFGIHHGGWQFCGTSPTEIPIGLLMSEIFNFSLVKIGGVLSHGEMDGESGSCIWVNISDHVKVKELGAIAFDNDLVN
jgi:hypothetical protein